MTNKWVHYELAGQPYMNLSLPADSIDGLRDVRPDRGTGTIILHNGHESHVKASRLQILQDIGVMLPDEEENEDGSADGEHPQYLGTGSL